MTSRDISKVQMIKRAQMSKTSILIGNLSPNLLQFTGSLFRLWASRQGDGVWQEDGKARCSNYRKWNSSQINICFRERMRWSVMEKSWEAWATRLTLILYTGGKITISPHPPLMMSLNGKDTTESITMWKCAAYQQSLPHSPSLLFYTNIYTYTQNWAN